MSSKVILGGLGAVSAGAVALGALASESDLRNATPSPGRITSKEKGHIGLSSLAVGGAALLGFAMLQSAIGPAAVGESTKLATKLAGAFFGGTTLATTGYMIGNARTH